MVVESKTGKEFVCEFFGIQLRTQNPNIARILTTDMGEFLSREVYHLTRRHEPIIRSQTQVVNGVADRFAKPVLVP